MTGRWLASAVDTWPNTPMVPTAPTPLDRYPLTSRRHIGQPLGGRDETRASMESSNHITDSWMATDSDQKSLILRAAKHNR